MMVKKQIKSEVKEAMKEIYTERFDKVMEIFAIAFFSLLGISFVSMIVCIAIHESTLQDGMEVESECITNDIRVSGNNLTCYKTIDCSYILDIYDHPGCKVLEELKDANEVASE